VQNVAVKAVVTPLLIGGATLAGRRWDNQLGRSTTRTCPVRQAPRWDIPVRMLVATAVTFAITAAPFIGPLLAGLLSPLPVFGIVLAVFSHHAHGPTAAIGVLDGLVIGLLAPVALDHSAAARTAPLRPHSAPVVVQIGKPQVSDLRLLVEVGGLEPPSHDDVPGLLRAQPPGVSRTRVVWWHRIRIPARSSVPERERAPRSGGACYRRPTRSHRQGAEDGHLSEVRQRARSCSWRL
jgi:hypothetical protein